MDILTKLTADHKKQRTLVRDIENTEGDSNVRQQLYSQLKEELAAHAIAEEVSLYSPLMAEADTAELARHSVAEHKDLDDLIKSVDELEMSSPGWLVRFKKLGDKVVHHVDEEEADVFPVAREQFSTSTREQMKEEFVQVKSESN